MISKPLAADDQPALKRTLTTGPVQLLERAWPLYFVGDSHVLMFTDLLFEDTQAFHQTFLTKARYCPGLTAATFTDAQGTLNPIVAQALVNEGLLSVNPDGSATPTHLVLTQLAADVSVARGRGRVPPILVIKCGDLDAREILLPQLPRNCDFVVPDDSTDLPNVPAWDVSRIVPTELILDFVNRTLTPLFTGLLRLRGIGFTKLFLHSVPPPTPSEHEPLQPVGLRYKMARLINALYRRFCAQYGIGFIDIWDDVTEGGLLDPAYFLDHIHLNKYGAMHTVNALIATLARDYQKLQIASPELWALAYEQAAERYARGAAPRDEELAQRFARDRIATIDVGRAFAERMLAQAGDWQDIGNRNLRLDWAGNPVTPATPIIRTHEPSQTFLDQVHEALYAPQVAEQIASCMGAHWTILSLRVFRSLTHEAVAPELGLHRDGGPTVILRGILYLNDVDENGGPFQYVNDAGEQISMLGPAGTLVIFDAERYLHRGSIALLRERHVLDIVFAPLANGDRPRVMWAGMNHWPIDPFQYTTDRCVISFGEPVEQPLVAL